MKFEKPHYITDERLSHFITEALAEDVGSGDHSTLASVSDDLQSRAHLLVKGDCVLAGVELASLIFKHYDEGLTVELMKRDGDYAEVGDVVFVVSGKASSILTVERFVLNCMQRMSGIATTTHKAVKLLEGTNTQLLDTRKTTPNFRMFEKWAVRIGGGTNHRFGLYDMIMLKDNHVDYAGGIASAVARTKEYLQRTGLDLKIELEVRNLEEVKEALAVGGVDIIMLDNMSVEDMSRAVKLIDGRAQTEASGNITADELVKIASTGVDFISSGAIIYNAPIVDLSLKAF